MLCLGALCAAFGPAQLRAQVPPIPQSLRDSIANPPKAERGDEVMRFETTHIDIGRINEDDAPIESTFRWENTGDKPLVVTRVETTCGCARPDYERSCRARRGH